MKKPSLIRELTFDVLASAAVFLAILWLAGAAQATDVSSWSKPEVKCVPTVTDYDHYVQVRDGIFAVVWWCEEPDGIYTAWFTGRVLPESAETAGLKALAIAGRDPIALEQFMTRPSSDAELSLVKDIEAAHAPRCYVVGTGQTAAIVTGTAQHAVGPAKIDPTGVAVRVPVGTIVTCADMLSKAPKPHCAVTGSIDTKGRRIEQDAWAACQIRKATFDGWNP